MGAFEGYFFKMEMRNKITKPNPMLMAAKAKKTVRIHFRKRETIKDERIKLYIFALKIEFWN